MHIRPTALGIMGEYIGRLYTEAKRRPLYHLAEEVSADVVAGEVVELRSESRGV